MARKILLSSVNGGGILEEIPVADEAQLQEVLKENPQLLPIEEFELTGPLMIIGRETTLPSGAVDLLGVARSGDILVVEFKTGPQNSDFRHSLAQMLDYGSHLWGMRYDEFESTVALRYFGGARCPTGSPVRNLGSLLAGAKATWEDATDAELEAFGARVQSQLERGDFRYALVAQRFPPTMIRTLAYMNITSAPSRFYAVELVRFEGYGSSAFEARAIVQPDVTRRAEGQRAALNESNFLDTIEDEPYREALRELFEVCRGLDLRFEWGVRGTSIRVATTDRAEPVTIGWVFPAGGVGWMGLSHLTLGYDINTAKSLPRALPALDAYVGRISTMEGGIGAKPKWLKAWTFPPAVVCQRREEILEAIGELAADVAAVG